MQQITATPFFPSRAIPPGEPLEATQARMLQLLDSARAITASDPSLSMETLQRMMVPCQEALRIRFVLLAKAGSVRSLQLFSHARERRDQA